MILQALISVASAFRRPSNAQGLPYRSWGTPQLQVDIHAPTVDLVIDTILPEEGAVHFARETKRSKGISGVKLGYYRDRLYKQVHFMEY